MTETCTDTNTSCIDLSLAGWGMQLVEKATNLFAICCDDRILFMNSAGLSLLGVSDLSVATGRPFSDFVHNDYKGFLEFGLEVLAEEGDFVPLKLVKTTGESLDVKMMVNELVINSQIGYVIEVQNITEYKRASEAVREREHRIKSILNTVTEGIFTFNKEGFIETFNPAAEKTFGYNLSEVVNKHVEILIPLPQREAYRRFIADSLVKGGSRLVGRLWEFTGVRKDGVEFPMEMTVTEMQVGSERTFTAVFRDITERKADEERIRHLAHHDNLTGLPNRHLFTDCLRHAVKLSKRNGKALVLMFVDLDKFKPINDTLGHEAGDIVLKEVGRRFRSIVREADTVARIGGDEFVFLIEDLELAQSWSVIAQKIIDSLAEPISAAGKDCVVGASIGVALYPDHGPDSDALMRNADEAMYAVKMSGRNGFKLYEPGLSTLSKKA